MREPLGELLDAEHRQAVVDPVQDRPVNRQSRIRGKLDRPMRLRQLKILLAIVKYVEDRWNLAHDTGAVGVPAIIVVEDNVRYYSSFLPVIYSELMHHAQNLMPEGLNLVA